MTEILHSSFAEDGSQPNVNPWRGKIKKIHALGRNWISGFANCPAEDWEVYSAPRPWVTETEGIETCWDMPQQLSCFIYKEGKVKVSTWHEGKGGPGAEGCDSHSPRAQPPCSVQDFTLIQRKWADSGTPFPSRCKTWLISRSWNTYSLSKAFDWDCWAFRDLVPSEISFLLNRRGRYHFVLHSMLWEYIYTTVHGQYSKNCCHDEWGSWLLSHHVIMKFPCNTLKLRNYIYSSCTVRIPFQ